MVYTHKAVATPPGTPELRVALTQAELDELAKRDADDAAAKVEEAKVFYQIQRAGAYPRVDELVTALWEKFVENRPDADLTISNIQARRDAVKVKYPKP